MRLNEQNSNPKLDRENLREELKQKAYARYVYLKHKDNLEISLDDELFLENFETAMQYTYGLLESKTM